MAAPSFTDEVSTSLDEHGIDHVRDTKVSFITESGKSETTIGGIADAAAALRGRHEQLSFEVGARYPAPEEASLNITGKGTLGRELNLGDTLTVRVVDGRGQIVLEAHGAVVDVGFKEHAEKLDKDGEVKASAYVERKHKIKLGDE